MAFSKITTRGMSGDTLEAGDIAANAIGASELADNAVDAGAIASGAVTAAKVADGLIEVKPHIKPGTLYPAVHGLIDGDDPQIIDSSATPHVIYLEGNRNIYHSPPNKNTNHSHKSAIETDGGLSQLRVAGHSDFAFGTGDFTIEMWAKFHDATVTNGLLTMWVDSSNTWKLSHYSNLEFFSNVGGTSVGIGAARTRTTTWHHFAIVRSGTGSNETKVYVDGTMFAQGTNALNFAAGTNLYLGTRTDNGTDFTTYSAPMSMNMIRIVKGKAVYTGNFAAPTALTTTGGTYSSATNITNPTSAETVLLVNSDVGSHSGAYGTAQSDGRKYYYTDIKGSKPIKDPRIGSHFGSQRYTFRSMQKLEQETATYGEEIFSLDGRENIRVGNFPSGSNYMVNNHWGNFFSSNRAGTFLEITGYFNDINIIIRSYTASSKTLAITVNGVTAHSALDLKSTVDSPLNVSRYVSVGMLRNIDITSSSSLSSDTALGINTIKFTMPATDIDFHGIELIAQDTSSTANKSKIQIPSQNVVSYGKKFTVSGTPHYNPFDGFTSGTDISGYIDTATSLGMSNWKVSSTWYRPFNGGRIVKWVDSSGNIKTSVTMMPPNAQNINSTASNAIDLSSSQTNDDTINFNTSAIDHSLSEIAKTFHWREFGNGSANGGTGSGSYPDFSMHINNDSTEDDMAYVMDDGLTSLTGKGSHTTSSSSPHNITSGGDAKGFHFTFIGTGITLKTTGAGAGTRTMAINLPYGTHIYKHFRDAGATPDGTIDGVALADIAGNTYSAWEEVTFHQPKMPPIPEDAVVLADYMLMADFVSLPASFADTSVPKGCRGISATRDAFSDGQLSANATFSTDYIWGYYGVRGPVASGSDTLTVNLPFFGTQSVPILQQSNNAGWSAFEFGGSATTDITDLDNTTSSHRDGVLVPNTAATLGQTSITVKATDNLNFGGFFLSTPIHTSSHYQSFETPYLKELVGGDRNMEQNNLIVTPDGKSWDEVTRDTSYIGNACVAPNLADSSGNVAASVAVVWNQWRGSGLGGMGSATVYYNKDFAIAYDRVICLVDGQYRIQLTTIGEAQSGGPELKVNGNYIQQAHFVAGNHDTSHAERIVNLVRGDYVSAHGFMHNNDSYQSFHIHRV